MEPASTGSWMNSTKRPGALMNNAIAAVFSLDVPSGVDCDAAKAAEGAVQADFTIAFDHLKPCHILAPGKGNCGYVELCAIGIPQEAADGVKSHFHIPDEEMVLPFCPSGSRRATRGAMGGCSASAEAKTLWVQQSSPPWGPCAAAWG